MPCHTEKQASSGNVSPFFRRPSSSMTLPPGALSASSGSPRIENGAHGRRRRRGADPVERLADHVLGLVAENRHRARIPDRDQAVLIGADQAVAERHGDPLEAPFGDAAEQAAEVDLVERHGGEIGGDGQMPERGVEDDGELGLQQHRAEFGRGRRGRPAPRPASWRDSGATASASAAR